MLPISQKAHDISFATFRVATLIKNKTLKGEIEAAAVELVARYEEVANPLLPFTTASVVEQLERLVSLAESIGEMKSVNALVLKRELGNLQTAIDFHANTYKGDPNGSGNDIDISKMFLLSGNTIDSLKVRASHHSKNQSAANGTKQSDLPASNQPVSNSKIPKTPTQIVVDGSETESDKNISSSGNGISIRQTAILRHIRETQFCRLRNIVDAMPNISERTIRNDIQGLIEQDLVRRVGGGGPNSYFETMELSLSDRARSLPTSRVA